MTNLGHPWCTHPDNPSTREAEKGEHRRNTRSAHRDPVSANPNQPKQENRGQGSGQAQQGWQRGPGVLCQHREGNTTLRFYGNYSCHPMKWLIMGAVPFFLILSLRGMVSGQLHGFSFSTQKSPAVSNTGYNQFNTISQQGDCCSSPRGQEAGCKYQKIQYQLAIEVSGYGISTKNKIEA